MNLSGVTRASPALSPFSPSRAFSVRLDLSVTQVRQKGRDIKQSERSEVRYAWNLSTLICFPLHIHLDPLRQWEEAPTEQAGDLARLSLLPPRDEPEQAIHLHPCKWLGCLVESLRWAENRHKKSQTMSGLSIPVFGCKGGTSHYAMFGV
jgi:hypothetical protein